MPGPLITEGMHPQYDLFKQWAAVKRHVLEEQLEDRFILFGEWVYARHSVHYRQAAALLLRVRHLRQAGRKRSSIWNGGSTCWKGPASRRCRWSTPGR